jgi:hypothetical protein
MQVFRDTRTAINETIAAPPTSGATRTFDPASAVSDFGARRRDVQVDPVTRLITIRCVSPQDMWTVLLRLPEPVSRFAVVMLARSNGRLPAGDGSALSGRGDACTPEDLDVALNAIEAGDIPTAFSAVGVRRRPGAHTPSACSQLGVHPVVRRPG